MDIMFKTIRFLNRRVILLLGVLVMTSAEAAVEVPPQTLGPTGIQGLLLTWPYPKEYIEVKSVDAGSPADGKVKAGDVIVGIGNEKFKGNPRGQLTKAIDAAETEAAGGKLTLLMKTGTQVFIEIPVMGTYSPTAPYNCPKSEKIIKLAVEALIQSIEKPMKGNKKAAKYDVTPTRTELLGLMATGEKRCIDVAAKLIHECGVLEIDPAKIEALYNGEEVSFGAVTPGWGWGYNLITLGEYYLLTKDASVLPAMRTYALGLARGQDPSGLWGHYMATARRGGRLPGYAQMNQPSLSNLMGMLIARKCGIKDPLLDKAIEKAYAYVVDHVDKGGFPYGVHGPGGGTWNNNGTSGSAAICMSIAGNQHGASYFSQIAAPSYDYLTSGHASAFFNPLWTPLGSALSGPEVTQLFFKNSLWYFNLERDWRGRFPVNEKAGSRAGQALLMYCLPRKALLITGREADPSIWVKGQAATDVVMRGKLVDEAKSTEELIKLLDYPLSQVSRAAAKRLREQMKAESQTNQKEESKLKKAKKEVVKKESAILPLILAAIDRGSQRARINAIACLGGECPAEYATPNAAKLGGIVRSKEEPLSVRIAAASALGSQTFPATNSPAYPFYNDVLRLAFEKRPEADPFGHVDTGIATAAAGICDKPFEAGLVTDKDLFYRASIKFMEHKRQFARAAGISMLRGMPLEDFHIVADKLMHAVANDDPSYHSYHNVQDTVAPGVEVLAGLNIKEGLDVLMNTEDSSGKAGFKAKMMFEALPKYGGNAKPYIAKLKDGKLFGNVESSRFAGAWNDMVKKIEQDKNPPKLITVEEAKRAGKSK